MKAGDSVVFPPEHVSDWLYVENGVARGGFTVHVIRARMSPEERAAHDAAYPFKFE